jgi:peptidoglycan pentaglycine glycine transferase (the first glycine)
MVNQMPLLTLSEWDVFTSQYPDVHLLQTGPWGELKSDFGWQAQRILVDDGSDNGQRAVGAQVLFRSLPLGLALAYIPKGPVGEHSQIPDYVSWSTLWPELDILCRQRRAVFLKVEPDRWGRCENDAPHSEVEVPDGFRKGSHNIQPRRTLVVDLRGKESQVLARMKQKTRYNIRLALKKEIVVYPSSDMETFHRLMRETGKRDVFGVHSLAYYRKAYELFHPRGECELLIAAYKEEPLAGVMVFAHGSRAWYFYGASSGDQRERMPTYLLQWEAMRWARQRGCTTYDLWGVPDFGRDILEANFTARSNGLWGVYRFKRGFGGDLRRGSSSWDRVYNPLFYNFYRWWFSSRMQDE